MLIEKMLIISKFLKDIHIYNHNLFIYFDYILYTHLYKKEVKFSQLTWQKYNHFQNFFNAWIYN